MVNISNFGNLPPPGRLGRITPSSGWNHVSEDELFDATLTGPRFREPFTVAGRPDAGEPLEFDMVADEVLFGAEMMVTDGHLALLSKLPGTARQGRLPQKVYKYQDRFMVQAIPSSGDQRGGGNRQGKPKQQPGQQSLDY